MIQSMDIVIITGMSGAGKSQAVDAFEDLGYYCMDNVPPQLIVKFTELAGQLSGRISRAALVVDARSRDMFTEYRESLEDLRRTGYNIKTLFLDCDSKTLIKRYKETRRRHPLMDEPTDSVSQAVDEERELLAFAKQSAEYIIDTTFISSNQLKTRVREIFGDGISQSMVISCMSFGFKHGMPVDADLVFDVRCLPNPFYIPELRDQTGLDKPVKDYVLSFEQATGLIPHLFGLFDYLLPLYVSEGKSQLVVAIGCTGGKHRSVVFSELLAEHLASGGYTVGVSHRDIKLANKK